MDKAALDNMIAQFKKGVYTSEFWLVLAAGVWTAVEAGYRHDQSFSSQAINLGLLGASAAYAVARSYLKGKRVEAVAHVSTGVNPGDTSLVAGLINDGSGDGGGTDTPPPVIPGPPVGG